MIGEILIYTSIYIALVAFSFYTLVYIKNIKRKETLFNENELPSLSIIIPAYNEEETIEKTIKNALNLYYPKNRFEVIVIDDGSKDNTYKIAKSIKSKYLRVFTKKNEGKAKALNFGISLAKGDFIITMDADTFADKNAAKEMIKYFKDKEIMCVTPSIILYKPKTIWQKLQQGEYLLGIYFRKVYHSLNSIYVTPGAFSAYRKIFFEKYGGFVGIEEENITEDLEMALRIQSLGYKIANAQQAKVYTVGPKNFRELTKQRKRWYIGLIKNCWNYRKLMNKKYGDLGITMLPLLWLSVFFSIALFFYFIFKLIQSSYKEYLILKSFNFNIIERGSFLFDKDLFFKAIENNFFSLFNKPIFLFFIFFIMITFFYAFYSRRKIGKIENLYFGLTLFVVYFSINYAIWWIISILNAIFSKKHSWG
ncbi:MAG: glycosyltransferase family 2 protein [Candidatus Pacearchaeota archaeon]